MKNPHPSLVARHASRRDGAALVIALCFLVIMSAVLLALFSSSRSDLVNSKIFASGQATTLLANTAVNLVEGQITDASSQPLVSWASQPGMIHAYDTGSGNTAYKLYSSDAMVVPNWSSSFQSAETTAMASWKTSTDPSSHNAMWCDLNAPAVVNRTSPTNTAVTVATPVFPIVDPGAVYMNGAGVVGFGFATTVAGTSYPATATDTTRRLPMPVKWMYLLKNGQLITPDASTSTTTLANFTGTVQPSSSNPIIGRIAFWADDETCKLNINTASEGTYWDTPRADVQSEWYLAASVPILDEFQAISGHPATTCLDPALGDLLPRPTLTDTSINTSSGAISSSGNYAQLQAYYGLNPRITDNAEVIFPLNPSMTPTTTTTSQGGTANTISQRNQNTLFVRSVVFKSDRLYATPDELLFRSDRTSNTNASGNPITPAMMAQRDFFLTAQSRASETTLFGTPRISLWPIQQIINTSQICQSARDKLIHFCATVGGTNYDFQRGQVSLYNSTYQTSPNPASTSVTNDWNIARNQSLFNYATNMMATTEPGFGSSLASKWGSHGGTEREMTMALDTIRSTLNQNGITSPTSSTSTPVWWAYRNELQIGAGIRGSVIPLQVTTPNGTFNGIGRDWRIASAAIQIIPTARNPKTVGPPAVDGWGANDPQPSTTQIQAILLLNFYNPMPTVQVVEPSFRITVTNPTGGLGLSIPGDPNKHDIGSGTVLLQYGIGGNTEFLRNYAFPGFAGLLYPANSGGSGSLRTFTQGPTANDLTNNYPWVTAPVTTNTNSPTVTINPGTIAIQIQEGGATTNTVQTENLYFPGWTNGPLPQSVTLSATSGAQTGGDPALLPFSSRSPQATSGNNTWFQNGDIVREVQLDPNGPTRGDYRLLATETNIPSNYFAPNVNYTNSFNAFVTTNAATTAAVQAEVGSMTNRFAFAFPNENNGSTWGVGNGYDSPLGNGGPNGAANASRLGGVAVTGVTWLGLQNGINSWRYGQEYTNNIGGLVSNLYGSMNNSQSTPVIAPVAPALSSSPSTTLPTTGWAPSNASGGLGDWSTSYSWVSDGAVFSAPDTTTWTSVSGATEPTYFSGPADWTYSLDEAVNEPNRVVPSPIIFGSQPTPKANSDRNGGVSDDLQPWQSMLLCPNPLAGSSHPGFGQGGTGTGPTALPPFPTSVPDHLFIDLFWMPVVEPYALSDPLSTAGKVNLNYEMEPFTHITRRTALVGVLTPVDIAAINNSVSSTYKLINQSLTSFPNLPNPQTRFPLNLDTNNVPGGTPPGLFLGTPATGSFTDFETRFSSGDVFRSASEVCMIDLVPYGQTYSGLTSWWSNNQLTGLNMRESPYNQIYSRITTKSNTYTVHYWVQSLQQVSTPGRSWTQWNEGQDVIAGEYRGNTTIQRYLDPNTTGLPDYATVNLSSYKPIDSYYSWRVLSQKQFAPGSN